MKRAWATILITLFCFPLAACGDGKLYSHSDVILGDAIALAVSAKGANAKKATDGMFALANEVFGEMDLSDENATLSRFNNSKAGVEFEISRHTYNVLSLAKTAYEKTNGAFDVTSLPLSELWRVDTAGIKELHPVPTDLDGSAVRELPSIAEVQNALEHVGMDKIDFFERDAKYYLTKSDAGTKVDLGGIAKGYFADLCRDIAEEYSLKSCLINLSGNLYLYGGGIKSGGDWSVGIVNPRPRITVFEDLRGYVAAVASGGNRSFVTSGDYQRFYYAATDEARISSEAQLLPVCHILNPKTGIPVGLKYDSESGTYVADYSAVCSATVSGINSALCDAYSTSVCVLGLEDGATLLKDEGLEGLIFTNPDLPFDPAVDVKEGEVTRTRQGKGKFKAVGEWRFIEGYNGYVDGYERAA